MSCSENNTVLLTTAEVRWFYRGDVPSRFREWFLDDGLASTESLRTDQYLLGSGTEGLGIKFRNGRIEIKQRFGQPESMVLTDGASGIVECWRKWGFPVSSANKNRALLETQDAWMSIQKTRMVHDYRLDFSDALAPVIPSDKADRMCSVELTDVCIENESWWTLAFEALGPADNLRHTLTCVARHVLRPLDWADLELANSQSYPRWLQRFTE